MKRFPANLHYDENSNILTWKDSNRKISISSIRTIQNYDICRVRDAEIRMD